MSYSQGIAQFADLFAPAGAPHPAAAFVARQAPPGGEVLDIGAGTGGTSLALAAAGCHVTALEPDAEMFAVLLTRLALRHELHGRVTPVPRPAGFALARRFDVACCFSVVHLLPPAERAALVAYAARQLRPGGQVVLEIPVVSSTRVAAPWQLVAGRSLGEATVEHHMAMAPAEAGWWHTHWTFRHLLGGELLQEVRRSFHWYPLPVDEALALVESAGLRPTAEYGSPEGTPFVPGESRVRLVVASAADL